MQIVINYDNTVDVLKIACGEKLAVGEAELTDEEYAALTIESEE